MTAAAPPAPSQRSFVLIKPDAVRRGLVEDAYTPTISVSGDWRTDGASLTEVADESPGPERRLQARDQVAALAQALAALPDRQRLAIVLRHLEDRPNPEIAAILDASVEAVESLLARARRDLARRLAPHRAALGFNDD